MPDDSAVRTGDDDYDAAHGAVYSSRLVPQLWAEAYGDEYPAEVEPFSSCTWWLLGRLIGGLRLRRDSVLVDLGCGRGGPGLWLARACSTRLIGVDFSEVATRLAGERAATFLRPGRAEFRRAAFADTGLPSGERMPRSASTRCRSPRIGPRRWPRCSAFCARAPASR
ncbi:SAM-dependent methyltransferase [Paractinoplanes durhamensis]|uniref:SAM-dependent methyltransferase n=1 Tax=Paractinoplanes durhamensis TaxID=113563 RepID=UPI00363D3C2F